MRDWGYLAQPFHKPFWLGQAGDDLAKCGNRNKFRTYVALLLVDMSDLEPDIGMSEWVRRVSEYLIETLQAIVVLAPLLVNDTQPEENLVGLVKV